MSSSCAADPLFLVLDTSVLIASPNAYHENATNNRKTALELLRSFNAGEYGSLPASLKVRIPWVVKLELMGLSNPDPHAWYHPGGRSSRAEELLEFLDEITYNKLGGVVSYQTYLESQEAKQLQKRPKDNDELVLLCCLQVRESYSRNTWLVTNDVRLSARAMRSGIGSLSLSALRHAMTLRNGDDAEEGDTFVDHIPEAWARLDAELHALHDGPIAGCTVEKSDKRRTTPTKLPFAAVEAVYNMFEWIVRICMERIFGTSAA